MLNWRKDKDSGQDLDDSRIGGHDQVPSAKELGEMLVAAGMITEGQFSDALAKSESEGMFIGRALVESGSIDRRYLTSFIVKECRIPHLSLVDYEINKDLLELIPKDVCLRHRVLPIDKLGRILTLAMVNPLDGEALADMRELCPQLKVKPILCDWEDYDQVATRLFASAGRGGGGEISMSSFGLSEPAGGGAKSAPAAPKPAPVADTGALAEAIAPAVETPQVGPGAGLDLSGLVTAVREGLRESNQETQALLRAVLENRSGAGDATGAPAAELASAIRESIKSAMDEAMRPVLERIAAAGPVSGVDAGELAEALRVAMKEAVGALGSRAAGNLEGAAGSGADGGGGAGQLEGIAQEIREAAASAMEALRAAMSAQKDTVEALATDYASKVKRFNTVQPFRNAGGDKAIADALEAVVLPEDARVRQALDASAPLAGFSFDSFLVSKANAFTVNIAQQIAHGPGGEHNPFFVFGPVGIGKTHLVNAVGNAIQEADEKRRVGYASAGRFAGMVMEALHEHATAAFREAYCHWDVLILDDVQFLGGHVEAQEEFFHIFNALHQEGRQIIIASDKAPDQLGELEQRLVSRFAGGMVTPLEPPDYETRVEILRRLTAGAQSAVADDVLAVVATRVPRDVRKMSGAMRKIIAFSGLVGQDVSCDAAYEILNKMGVAEAVAS